MESILTSIKKMLGIAEEYYHFDYDLIIYINSAFSVLTQLGVGPSKGFVIYDNKKKWDDFIENDNRIEFIKSYVFLKTKLLFDPPSNSSLLEAFKQQIGELEWRINTIVDN